MFSGSRPVCEPIVQRSSVAENETVDFTCRMTYRWHSLSKQSLLVPAINVSFGWDSETHSNMALTTSSSSELTVVQNMTVVGATKPAIPAQKCTVSFTFAPGQSTLYSFAVNPVSYTCSSDPIPVRCKFLCSTPMLVVEYYFLMNNVLKTYCKFCTAKMFPRSLCIWCSYDNLVAYFWTIMYHHVCNFIWHHNRYDVMQ